MSNGSIRGSSSSPRLASRSAFPPGHTSSSGQDLDSSATKATWEKIDLPAPVAHHHPQFISSLSPKRKFEVRESHLTQPPPKVCRTWRPPKWEPPHRVPNREADGSDASICAATDQSQVDAGAPVREKEEQRNQKQIQQFQSCPTWRPSKQEEANDIAPHDRGEARRLPTTLMFDPRVKDFGKLNPEEKMEMVEMAREARALVLTLVYRDGTTQLDPEQVSEACPQVKDDDLTSHLCPIFHRKPLRLSVAS